MSGIGISPCPPFANRAGLPPGVLWDGNTAAWYKYNDPVAGVVKDGANRVSVWFDKMNYAVGANIMPNPLNFLNVAWGVAGAAVKVNNNTFTTGVAPGGLNNIGIALSANKTIKISYSVTITAGVNFQIGDGAFANIFPNITGTGILQTGIFYIRTVAGWTNGISLWLNSAGAQIVINYFTVEIIVGNHLLQYTGANQPLWSSNGVLFDGANDFMKALTFPFVQPEMIYFVGKQITWSIQDNIFDGNTTSSGQCVQSGVSPNLSIYAGISINNNTLPLNTLAILRALYNGANSAFIINNISQIGNTGVNNMNGFNLGCRTAPDRFSNMECKEIILRRSADNNQIQTDIYNYLKSANNVP